MGSSLGEMFDWMWLPCTKISCLTGALGSRSCANQLIASSALILKSNFQPWLCFLIYFVPDVTFLYFLQDNPHFDMMFDEVCNVEAYSCASKYAFARSIIKLNTLYTKRDIKVLNFDSSYIEEGVIWSSNNGDCLVLMRICFYASNLLCLSLCPMP